jgi:hypothetical protein
LAGFGKRIKVFVREIGVSCKGWSVFVSKARPPSSGHQMEYLTG